MTSSGTEPSSRSTLLLSRTSSSISSSSLSPSSHVFSCSASAGEGVEGFSLESVRESLIRQEDTIIFALIERAKYPTNSSVYDPSYFSAADGSFLHFFCKESEILLAKAGWYQNAEELPFFPDGLPAPLMPTNYSQVLHPAASSININKKIWNLYIEKLLPLFSTGGDDGNYASTAANDLACLQAISRRIHFGRFVAEVKFRDAPQEYNAAIHSQDADALMKLLTFESVEEAVKRRVEKKAMIIGQNIYLDDNKMTGYSNDGRANGKINPAVLSRLYGEWIIPLTKLVEVEYLLHRLD